MDVKKGGGGSDLKAQLTLSGDKVNMSTAPKVAVVGVRRIKYGDLNSVKTVFFCCQVCTTLQVLLAKFAREWKLDVM